MDLVYSNGFLQVPGWPSAFPSSTFSQSLHPGGQLHRTGSLDIPGQNLLATVSGLASSSMAERFGLPRSVIKQQRLQER